RTRRSKSCGCGISSATTWSRSTRRSGEKHRRGRSRRAALGIFLDLPLGGRLRPELDALDVGIDAAGGAWRRGLPLFFLFATLGFLLPPLDEAFLALTLRGGGSGVTGHARSAYTHLNHLVTSRMLRFRFSDSAPMIQLPDRISRLTELAYDLWWSWRTDARNVFRRLDYPLWRLTAHNPVRMLQLLSPEALDRALRDPEWLAGYDSALARLDAARAAHNTWIEGHFPEIGARSIAYFSAEFALHQSLPIYAGGLGVLAGDHCKEASDLGLPLIGVGFMYPQGYFHQSVSPEGWQQEIYERLSWEHAPINRAITSEGKPCIVAVPLGNRSVLVSVWLVRLGRVRLYLLDTDLEENAPWDRDLSARLYGGDRETRVQQEIILGIGGVRALKAIGAAPAAWHLNEGHAAFVVLQRIRDLIEHGESFESALEEV